MTKSSFSYAFTTLIVVLGQELIVDNKDGNYFQDWVVINPYSAPYKSTYNSQIIFGGSGKFDETTQIQILMPFLPEHDIIILKFQIIIWDWTMVLDKIYVYVDGISQTGQVLINTNPQIKQFSFQFSHVSISVLINIQPLILNYWGLINFQLYTDKTTQDNIFFTQIGVDYRLVGNLLTSTEGWQDMNQQQSIGVCADFKFVFPNNPLNIIINRLIIPPCDFFSIYFKVVSIQFLQKIILTIESYQISTTVSSSVSYSCSNFNINYLILYSLAFENIKSPPNRIVQIIIQTPQYNFGIRDFEIHFYKNETIPHPVVGCSEFQLGQCMNCLEGWNYQNNQKICLPICGDKKIQYGEQCDDGNNVPYDGCYQCKFQCQQNCDLCVFGVCQRYKIQTQIALLDCNSNPLIYNIYNESQKKRCKQVCGDGIVDLWEECDDTNNISYDGCFQCKYSCPLNCQNCIQGRCNQCLTGYYLQNNSCQPICGDNIKQNEEQCDDGNLILFDGCYKCQNNCKLGCQQCINFYCLQCMDGWHFNNGECEQICGDNQIAIISPEQCDDSTIQSCLNCEIQCGTYCHFCENLNNCFQCYGNIELINGQCITQCGDGVVTDWEQCDDANNMQNDGCFNCKFECIFGCLECQTLDTCDQCDSQFFYLDQLTQKCVLYAKTETYDATDSNSDTENNSQNNANNSSAQTSTNSSTTDLSQSFQSTNQTQTQITILINNSNSSYGYNVSESTLKLSEVICKEHYILINGICVSLCGNGVLESDYEECDDGNQDGGDGCSFQCYVEESYKCVNIENSISQCTYLTKLNFVLTLLSDLKSAKQIVQISFTQQVKLAMQLPFEEIASFTIFPTVEALIHLVSIVNATTDLDDVKYNIIVEFQQSVENPSLDVSIMKSNFYSDADQELQSFNKTIKLGNPFVLSKSTQTQVNSIVQMNDAMMYSMAGISGLSILTGNVGMFFNMLDLLQQLSYLRFMRYQFPDHLEQFLQTFSKISLKPLIDQLHIDEYIAKINGGKLPFQGQSSKQSASTQSDNAINAYYLMNAKSCYISLLVSLSTYIISSTVLSKKIQNYIYRFLLRNQYSTQFIQKLFILNQKIRMKCFDIKQTYFFSGMFQFYFAIMHQFIFSCCLQFPYYSFDSLLNVFNSINAICSIAIILIVGFTSFTIPTLLNKNIKKWRYFYTENTNKFWTVYFKSIQMLKIVCYILIISFCINYPQVQSFLLSMQSAFYLVYLFKFQPIKQKIDQMKLIVRETFFILIVGSFLLYSFSLTNDQMLLFGWLHIYSFVAIMATQLAFDTIKQIIEIYQTYLKELRIKQLKQEAIYYNNPLQKFILIEHQDQNKFATY